MDVLQGASTFVNAKDDNCWFDVSMGITEQALCMVAFFGYNSKLDGPSPMPSNIQKCHNTHAIATQMVWTVHGNIVIEKSKGNLLFPFSVQANKVTL